MVRISSKVSSKKVSSKGAEDTTASPDQSSGGRELQILVGVSSKLSSRGAEDATASPDQSAAYDCISRSIVSAASPDQPYPLHLQISQHTTASPDQSHPLHLQISRILGASDWSAGREL